MEFIKKNTIVLGGACCVVQSRFVRKIMFISLTYERLLDYGLYVSFDDFWTHAQRLFSDGSISQRPS